jgi:hypothetical protein
MTGAWEFLPLRIAKAVLVGVPAADSASDVLLISPQAISSQAGAQQAGAQQPLTCLQGAGETAVPLFSSPLQEAAATLASLSTPAR